MEVKIGDKNYQFLVGYQADSHRRTALDNLVKKIFDISFESWYQAGYWNEKYIPYTLFDGDKAVANVSVNLMDFYFFGESKRTIQIGTVLTDEAYRNQSLSRFLMEKVLKEWAGKPYFTYLFANSSAVKMYPKFGFRPVKEYAYFKKIHSVSERSAKSSEDLKNIKKLELNLSSNRDFLYEMVKKTPPFSRISIDGNADSVMFSALFFLKDNIYYFPSLEVIVVAKVEGNALHLWDIFGKKEVDLDQVIDGLINFEALDIHEVLLGFTPVDTSSYQMKEISDGDTLFILENKTDLFDQNKLMFPLLSHA